MSTSDLSLYPSELRGDRLLSPVVDGTQLKLQQQMEKQHRATSHAPYLCGACIYIYLIHQHTAAKGAS